MSKVLIFDTETGGLELDNSVLSLGALVGDLSTGEVTHSFETLIKSSEYNVTDKAMEINGIDLNQCSEEGKTPEEAAILLSDLWVNGGAVVMGGHNLSYDIRMVCQHLFQCSQSEFEANFSYRTVDSLSVILMLQGVENLKSGKTLSTVAKILKIDTSKFKSEFASSYLYKPASASYHTALFDSYVCFKILCKFYSILGLPENVKRLQS